MLYQGGNSPIILTFDEPIDTTELSVALYTETGTLVKAWAPDEMTILGAQVTLQLTQEQSAAFPKGKVVLEAKWLDAAGTVQMAKPAELTVAKRFDRTVIL